MAQDPRSIVSMYALHQLLSKAFRLRGPQLLVGVNVSSREKASHLQTFTCQP